MRIDVDAACQRVSLRLLFVNLALSLAISFHFAFNSFKRASSCARSERPRRRLSEHALETTSQLKEVETISLASESKCEMNESAQKRLRMHAAHKQRGGSPLRNEGEDERDQVRVKKGRIEQVLPNRCILA